MDKRRLYELEEKWLAGNLNKEEREELDNWYNSPLNEIMVNSEGIYSEENHQKNLFNRITKEISEPKSKYLNFKRVLAAAAILSFLIIGILVYKNYSTTSPTIVYRNGDLLPGSVGATVTLANGKKIFLNTKEGSSLKDYSVNISKIIPSSDNSDTYNQISTNRGEKFSFTLSDGTKVWLNAISSIRFPTLFQGKERKVIIQGEAYFEVAKDAVHPFVVITDKQNEVRVLGTHFNVNAYSDNEAEKVTLLEGMIQFGNLSKKQNYIQLRPGQQAIEMKGSLSTIAVNGDDFIDWKNDQFVFDGETLDVIMKRLSRWYSFDYAFEKESDKAILFTGIISGRKSLKQVLNVFTLTNKRLEFSLKDNKLAIKNSDQ